MAGRRSNRTSNREEGPSHDAEVEKHVDATDEEQSSDDEAPEEVSAAAATALAGRRRKAEQQARQAAPKRKRARTTKGGGNKNASGSTGGGEGDGADGDSNDADELELPPDLLLKVKSGGLQRMEADVLAAREAEDAARKDALAKDGNETRGRVRAGDIARSDNFRLVVLDGGDGDAFDAAATSKVQAAENAKNFLRGRRGKQKRVSHTLFQARKRIGPSPDF